MRKKMIKMLIFAFIMGLVVVKYGYATNEKTEMMEMIEEMSQINNKKAYLTFDDGPSVHSRDLMKTLDEFGIPGIFFVTGKQIEYVSDSDEILAEMLSGGHHIALHSMTHEKDILYHKDDSSDVFVSEMLELKNIIYDITGHETNLCRAPFGKRGHFTKAHEEKVGGANLYCVDWHVDSRDWQDVTSEKIYTTVATQLAELKDEEELVLLFHEYERTAVVLPRIIELLKSYDFIFPPYEEGHVFKGLE